MPWSAHCILRNSCRGSNSHTSDAKAPTSQAMKELILGGVRSGKSRLAEERARASGLHVVYIATAIASGDAELEARIRQHRLRRPANWTLVEEPLALGAALRLQASAERCLVVECLTLWLTNLLLNAAERF